MGLFRIVVLLALIFALLELSQVATGLETKVTGGNTAYQGQFPYQVRLYIVTKTGSAYICGASIISPHVLLSAANCFYGLNLNYVQVIAGNIYTDISFAGQQIAYVSTVLLHSAYNPNYYTNDLAILLLYTPLQYTAYVQPIPLPAATATFADNLACTIAGFGKATYGGPLSSTLNYATVNLVNLQTCAAAIQKYGMLLYTNQLCSSTVATAACNGDGGGALVCRGLSRAGVVTNVVAGILSYGVNCNSGVPEVNTRVSSFSDLVNAYVVTYKVAIVSASPGNCTDGDVDCYPKVASVQVLKDDNSTSTNSTSTNSTATTITTTTQSVKGGQSTSDAVPALALKQTLLFAPIVAFALAVLLAGKRD